MRVCAYVSVCVCAYVSVCVCACVSAFVCVCGSKTPTAATSRSVAKVVGSSFTSTAKPNPEHGKQRRSQATQCHMSLRAQIRHNHNHTPRPRPQPQSHTLCFCWWSVLAPVKHGPDLRPAHTHTDTGAHKGEHEQAMSLCWTNATPAQPQPKRTGSRREGGGGMAQLRGTDVVAVGVKVASGSCFCKASVGEGTKETKQDKRGRGV